MVGGRSRSGQHGGERSLSGQHGGGKVMVRSTWVRERQGEHGIYQV